MALIKTTRINFLFDFYQSLLTDKQRIYMELYYLEDYSLGEIAGEFGISRQAVYDNVRRSEVMLEDYEMKLHLFSKFQKRLEIIESLDQRLVDSEISSDEIKETLITLKDYL